MALDPLAAVRLALSPQEPVGRRLAKLKALKQHASQALTGSRSGHMPFWLSPSLQQLLPLLLDTHPDLRAATASTVALLGSHLLFSNPAAQQQQQRRPGSDPPLAPTHLFDWVHAVGCGQTPPGPPLQLPASGLSTAQQASLLSAISLALSSLPPTPAATTALVSSWALCMRLLEAPSTTPALLPALLTALNSALQAELRCYSAPGGPAALSQTGRAGPPPLESVFVDLVDLSLGWSLDPAVSPQDRSSIHAFFLALRPYWQHHTSFATNLCTSLTQDLVAMAQLPDPTTSTHSTDTAASMQQFTAPPLVDMPACLRLAASLSVLMQALCPPISRQPRPPPSVPTPATWGLLQLLPQVLTALSTLLSCTQQEHDATTAWQQHLTTMRPPNTAPARRARTAAIAEAETQLLTIAEDHQQLTVFVSQVLQQLPPLMRDLVVGGHVCWPLPPALLTAMTAPACPHHAAAPAAPVDQLSVPASTNSTQEVSSTDVLPASSSSDTLQVLPEVHAVVQDILGRVLKQAEDDDRQPPPVGQQPAGQLGLTIQPGEEPTPDALLSWVVAGSMELLLQTVCHAATPSNAVPGLLNTCAMLLCVADGVSEDLCAQLASDTRLLGRGGADPGPCRGGSQVQGVWDLQHNSDPAIQRALANFFCDVLTMPGQVSEQVFGSLTAAVSASTATSQQSQALFSLAVLRLACSRGSLTAAQLQQVAGQLAAQLQQACESPRASAAEGGQATASAAAAVFQTWALCLGACWSSTDTGGTHPSDTDCTIQLVQDLSQSLLLVDQLLVSKVLEATDQSAPAAVDFGDGKAVVGRVSYWPVHVLQQAVSQPPGTGAAQHTVRLATALGDSSVQDDLFVLLEHMSVSEELQVRQDCLQALQLLAQWGPRHAGAHTAQGAGMQPAAHSQADVLLRVSVLALALLGDSDTCLSGAALPLVLSTSAAPLAALGSPGQPTACTQFVSAGRPERQLLQPPEWHTSCGTGTAGSTQYNWRPVQLARLFGILFPDIPVTPPAAEKPAETAQASSKPQAAPAPGPSVLLRRRTDLPPTPPSQPAAAAPAPEQSAPQLQPQPAVIGSALLAVATTTGSKPTADTAEPGAATSVLPTAVSVLPSPWVELASDLSPTDTDLASTNAPPHPLTTAAAAPQAAGAADSAPTAPAAGTTKTPRSGTHAPCLVWQVIQDAAAACVAARMKTHLGGPSQSLAALERLLPGLLAQIQTANKAADRGSMQAPGQSTSIPSHSTPSPQPAAVLESGWLALEFVDALEQHITAAIHGGVGAQGLPPALVAFFCTNAKVCEDWFLRTRQVRLQIAVALSAHHSVVKHGSLRLHDLHQAALKIAQSTHQADSAAGAGGSTQPPSAVSAEAPAGRGAVGKGQRGPGTPAAGPKTKTSASPAPAPTPTPTLLRKQPPSALAPAASLPATPPAGSTATTSTTSTPPSTTMVLRSLLKDLVATAQGVAEALLALGDWQSLEGLHHWLSSSVTRLLQPTSSGPDASATAGKAGSGVAAGGMEDPWMWLLGLSHMAQGRYEQALYQLNTFLRQQSQRSAGLSTMQLATSSGQPGPAQPQQPVSPSPVASHGSPGVTVHDLHDIMSTLQPTVATHIAQCYASVTDWSHFHSFVTFQHRRAQTQPQQALWWAPCLQDKAFQDICALASFDMNGPNSPELKDFKTSTIQRAVLLGLQQLHSRPAAPLVSQVPASAQPAGPSQPFMDALSHAWPAVCEPARTACWQGWHPGLRASLTTSHLLTTLASVSPSTPAVPAGEVPGTAQPPRWCAQVLDMLGATGSTRGLGIGGVVPLLLPNESYTPADESSLGISFTMLPLPTLTHLLRLQHTLAPVQPPAAVQQLMLLVAASARSGGNTELAVRMCDKLSELLSMSSREGGSSGSSSGMRAAIPSQQMVVSALAAAKAHIMAEVGAMPPHEAADKQLQALRFLVTQPKDLLQLAALHSCSHQAVHITTAASGKSPVKTGAAGPSSSSLLFTAEGHMVPATSVAAGLLSLAHWTSRCTPASVAALAAGGRPAAGPVAVTDWLAVLKTLSAQTLPLPTPHDTLPDQAGPVAPPGEAPAAASTPQLRGMHLEVPQGVQQHHAFQAAMLVGALHLAPSMSRAWLQWGMTLLTWQREARHRPQQPPQQQPQQQPSQAATGVSDEEQLAAAAVQALCMWLLLSWQQEALAAPEDATAVLLRILQLVVRHGHNAEHDMQAHLMLPPPAAWQTLTPQLFAQLRHQQAGVRLLVLSLLQRVAQAAPFAVLYPALSEVESMERSHNTALEEIQVLLHGLDASHPRLMSDVRTLMTEAERLTVTWEERWHSILSELDVDVARRCVTLRAEAERLEQTYQASSLAASMSAARSAAASPAPAGAEASTDTQTDQHPQTPSSKQPRAPLHTPAKHAATSSAAAAAAVAKALGQTDPAAPAPADAPTATSAGTKAAAVGDASGAPQAPGRGRSKRDKHAGRGGRGQVVKFGSLPTLPPTPAAPPPQMQASTTTVRTNAWTAPLAFVSKTAQAKAVAPVTLPGSAAPGPPVTGWGAGGIQDLPDLDLEAPGTATATGVDAAGGATGTSQAGAADQSQTEDSEAQLIDEAQAREAAAEQRRAMLCARYATLMSPVVLALERSLRACIACVPETPAEMQFVNKVLPQLTAAVAAFKHPPADAINQLGTTPQVCWAPLKAVLQQLDESLKRTSLDLAHYSPALAALVDTDLPMPGLAVTAWDAGQAQSAAPHSKAADRPAISLHTGGSGVTIAGVHPVLRPLFTKTRPKRLVLVGSDSNKYVFLLKGRDDLRMDERIMQVVRVSNSLIRADPAVNQLGVAARHYSVTPLGERVGLIQWVDHTVSLFSLFRDWQAAVRERHAAVQAAKDLAAASQPPSQQQASAGTPGGKRGGPGSGGGGGATTVPKPGSTATGPGNPPAPMLPPMVTAARPADLFYARLLPELRAAGLSGMVPRKQWPQAVLQRVLATLARQAPMQMVAQQLQGSSASAVVWWGKQRAYAASLAVNSILGYLVGLGDRHLDNILMDSQSGELVHIDFNVCFERGLLLRVPEIVPFRLTQSLAAGLGPAWKAAGGSFRSTCCLVLSALQRRREALIALLDAVLGDPLVVWSEGGGREAAARRDLELAVTLTLFVSRVEESRDPLAQQCQSLLGLLQGPGKPLLSYIHQHQALHAMKTAQQQSAERLQAAKDLASQAQETLAPASTALQSAVAAHRSLQSEARGLQEAGTQLVTECSNWISQHTSVLTACRDDVVPELSVSPQVWSHSQATVPLTLMLLPPPSDTSGAAPQQAVLAGLLDPTQPPPQELMAEDQQGLQLMQRWDLLLDSAQHALTAYGAVLRELLPASYPLQSYHHAWAQVISGALAATSPLAMEEAKAGIPVPPDQDTSERLWRALHAAQDLAAGGAAQVEYTWSGSQDPATNTSSPQSSDQSQLWDMLASFAAEDHPASLGALRSALAQCLNNMCDSLHSAADAAMVQPGQHANDDTTAGAGSNEQEPASPAGQEFETQSCLSLPQRYAALFELIRALDRTGLLWRLLGYAVQPHSATDAVAEHVSGAGQAVKDLLHTLSWAATATDWCRAASRGVVDVALTGVVGHVSVGEVSVLRQATGELAAAVRQLQELRDAGEELQLAVTQHQQLVAAHRQQHEETQAALDALGSRLHAMQPGSAEHAGLAQQHQQHQQQLQSLHQAHAHHSAMEWQLHDQAQALHRGVAAAVQQLYVLLFGPACQLAADFSQQDGAAWQEWLAASVPAPATPRPAPALHFGSIPLFDEPASNSGGGGAGTPAEVALHTASQRPSAAGVGAHKGVVQPAESLLQSLPGPDAEDWGSVQPHHLLAAPAALVFSAAQVCAAPPGVYAEQAAGDEPAQWPPVLQCWSRRLQAVELLSDVCQEWCDQAMGAHSSSTSEPTSGTPAAGGDVLQGSQMAAVRHSLRQGVQECLSELSVQPVHTVIASLRHFAAALDGLRLSDQVAQVAPPVTSAAEYTANGAQMPTVQSVGPAHHSQPAPHTTPVSQPAPELIAFTDFDPSVAGLDMELGALEAEEEDEKDDTALQNGLDMDLSDVLLEAPADAVTGTERAVEAQSVEHAPLPTADQVLEVLSEFMAGQHSLIRRQLVFDVSTGVCDDNPQQQQHSEEEEVAVVKRYLEASQRLRLRHMAAFGWMHEHLLGACEGVLSTEPVIEEFFKHVSWNPLEPTAKLPMTNRQQIVMSLQRLCDDWPGLRDELVAWEARTGQAALGALASTATAAGDMQFVSAMVQTHLSRRAAWMAGACRHGEQLSRTCAAVVQFEVSRQGAAWAPGSPLVVDSFASCLGLLSKVERVYAALGDQHTAVVAAQDTCRVLQAQLHQAVATQHKEQVQLANLEAQLSASLPLMAMVALQVNPVLATLAISLPAATTLVCKELGPMLKELMGMTSGNQVAKDVASLAAAVITQHSSLSSALSALNSALPDLKQHVTSALGSRPVPASAIPHLLEGRIPGDPALVSLLRTLGASLVTSTQATLEPVLPHLHALHEVPAALPRLTTSLESLATAASTVAAAIQSEHALDPVESDAEGADLSGEESESEGGVTSQPSQEAVKGSEGGVKTQGSQGEGTPVVLALTGEQTPPRGATRPLLAEGAEGLISRPQRGAHGRAKKAAAATPASRTRARQAWIQGHTLHPSGSRSAELQQQLEAQRKAYAVNALRRCIQKLERKDVWDVQGLVQAGQGGKTGGLSVGSQGVATAPAGAAKQVTVGQQVDVLIQQAESHDNLCRMFEGWMPWL